MKEVLRNLAQAEVKAKMQRLETPGVSRADYISHTLSKSVYGQPEACDAVARRIAIAEAGFADPTRPMASVYSLGGSGTGKTELAHALAGYMFEDPNSERLKIINMGEFQEAHTAMRFVGAPPSYVGYNEKPEIPHEWLHKGRSIIVFDEVEKAHPSIHRMLLSILDKGKINARAGGQGVVPLNFTQSFIFFTSNIAANQIQNITEGRGKLGFSTGQEADTKNHDISQVAHAELKKSFSPEFIARLDEVVVFKPLEGRKVWESIFYKFITQRNQQLHESMAENAPFFTATNEFKDFILASGGQNARQIRNLLEKEMFAKAANAFMGEDLTGQPIVADYEDENVVFYTDRITPPDENVLFDRSLLQQ